MGLCKRKANWLCTALMGEQQSDGHCVRRDAAAFALIKASGAIVWGASDILQVRYSNLPSMQSLGDSSTTLGLLFASIGFACFIGPVISNRVTPPRCLFCKCCLRE